MLTLYIRLTGISDVSGLAIARALQENVAMQKTLTRKSAEILDAYGTRGHALQQFTGDRLSIQPCGPLLCS